MKLNYSNDLRKGETQLLLCHTKPYGAASKDTISRWIKTVIMKAGVDTSVFKPHSTRSAAMSAAKVSKDHIMTTAGLAFKFEFLGNTMINQLLLIIVPLPIVSLQASTSPVKLYILIYLYIYIYLLNCSY